MSNQSKFGENDIEREFDEMKVRYENFISYLDENIQNIKENVFYHMVDENRTKEKLINMARETRSFMAKEIWDLLDDYMDFLRNIPSIEGNNYKAIYQNFSREDFVKRLLFKRPLVFVGGHDHFLMRNHGQKRIRQGECASQVAKILDPLSELVPYLREYISYDENLLSSLIGMSTPTFYINIGSGRPMTKDPQKPYIEEGILCGLVGARNEKAGFMENRYVFPRNNELHSNAHLSDEFWIHKVYKDAFPQGFIPTVSDIKNNKKIYKSIYIDGINEVYLEKRLKFSVIPYIKEAAARGREQKRNIFCSVPPIGGGVWAFCINKATVHRLIVTGVLKFLDENFDYEEMKYLKALVLPPISTSIYNTFAAKQNIKKIKVMSDTILEITFKEPPNHKIKIFNQVRYIAELLPEEFKDCISIAGYAWDGNSYPGNEYWVGGMMSFDPQAIYSSLLGQFQNPEVNVHMADPERIRIY